MWRAGSTGAGVSHVYGIIVRYFSLKLVYCIMSPRTPPLPTPSPVRQANWCNQPVITEASTLSVDSVISAVETVSRSVWQFDIPLEREEAGCLVSQLVGETSRLSEVAGPQLDCTLDFLCPAVTPSLAAPAVFPPPLVICWLVVVSSTSSVFTGIIVTVCRARFTPLNPSLSNSGQCEATHLSSITSQCSCCQTGLESWEEEEGGWWQ